MEPRVTLDADISLIKDHNEVYKILLNSPPLKFAKIARQMSLNGAVAEWHQSTDSSARVLACACDLVLGDASARADLMREIRLADKSAFENFDRIAYLVDALMLARKGSNIEYYDMARMPVESDKEANELRDMLGNYAEHFWRDMPYHFFHHVCSHLTEPYRLQRLSRWVEHNWPEPKKKTNDDDDEFMLNYDRQSNFDSGCKSLILKTLLTTNIGNLDSDSLLELLKNNGEKDPLFKTLSPVQREQVLLSLGWTARMLINKNKRHAQEAVEVPAPEPVTPVLYKNFSGMYINRGNFKGMDLKGGNFLNAGLNQADLSGAKLNCANMTNISVMYGGAVFDTSPPDGANFADADMTGVILQGARVEGFNLKGTILRDADFRHAVICGDNKVSRGFEVQLGDQEEDEEDSTSRFFENVKMRLNDAADFEGVSFAHAFLQRASLFEKIPVPQLDLTGCTFGAGGYGDVPSSLEEILDSDEAEEIIRHQIERGLPDAWAFFTIRYYLAQQKYHEKAHAIMKKLMQEIIAEHQPAKIEERISKVIAEVKAGLEKMGKPVSAEALNSKYDVIRTFAQETLVNAEALSDELDLMQLLEDRRVAGMRSAVGKLLSNGHLDLASIMNLRKTDKALAKIVQDYFLHHPTVLLDYCLQFSSTAKLNEVAAFVDSFDGYALSGMMTGHKLNRSGSFDSVVYDNEYEKSYAQLFATLLQSRLKQSNPAAFAEIKEQMDYIACRPDFSFTDLHRLTYLAETFCSDMHEELPVTLKERLQQFDLWALTDEVVHNLETPARLFRLGEFITPILDAFRHVVPFAGKDRLPKDIADLMPAIAILSSLFTNVNWKGHKQLEKYFDKIRPELKARYGKELCSTLYASLWSTREIPRGSSRYPDNEKFYRNYMGIHSDEGHLFHENNVGANLKDAVITGGMGRGDSRFDMTNAWLKDARLVVHSEDDRRSFETESFRDANLCGARIEGVNLQGADMSGADLRYTVWTGVNAGKLNLGKANIQNMKVDGKSDFVNAKTDGLHHDVDLIKYAHRADTLAAAKLAVSETESLDELLAMLQNLDRVCYANEALLPTSLLDRELLSSFVDRYQQLGSYHEDFSLALIKELEGYGEQQTELRNKVSAMAQMRQKVPEKAADEHKHKFTEFLGKVSGIFAFAHKDKEKAAEKSERKLSR